jgi:hypothetical protein
MSKSLCVFSHYSAAESIPYYVEIFVQELCNHFDQLILVTNNRPFELPRSLAGVTVQLVENEGYDFGMFYKVLSKIELVYYSEIALINDSNILFGKLDTIIQWGRQSNLDFWGLYDANITPKFVTSDDNYHIQSHFLVLKAKALTLLPAYFESVAVERIFAEKVPKKVRELVIDQWEIGLSRFLRAQKINLGSFINAVNFCKTHGLKSSSNLSLKAYQQLILAGIPLIKKKAIASLKVKHFLQKSPLALVEQFYNLPFEKAPLLQEVRQLKINYLKAKLGLRP